MTTSEIDSQTNPTDEQALLRMNDRRLSRRAKEEGLRLLRLGNAEGAEGQGVGLGGERGGLHLQLPPSGEPEFLLKRLLSPFTYW